MSDKLTSIDWSSADGMETLLDAAASALVLVNNRGKIEFASRAIVQIFGLEPKSLIGCHISMLLLPTMRQPHNQYIEKFFKLPFSREMGEGDSFPAQHANGSTIYVSIGLQAVKKNNEQFVLATITRANKLNQTVVSLKQSQSKLSKHIHQNSRLTKVAQDSSDAVFLLSPNADITWINRTTESLIGEKIKGIANKSIMAFISKYTPATQISNLHEALDEGSTFSGEVSILHGSQSIQVDCSLQPVFEHDVLQGFYFTAKDVTHRRRLEAQLRENSELLETTARIASLGFYSLDLKTNKLNWSEEVYNIHDLPKNYKIEVDEAIRFYAPEAQPVISRAVEHCMTTGEAYDLELPFITAKRRRIWVRAVGYAEFHNGQPIKLKGAFQDITSLRQAALDAEQAAVAKSQFLANMSHELRTPITGVMGVAELLSQTTLDPKQKQFVEVITHSADSLLFLVNQVLDYAKLEAGAPQLVESEFNLRAFVQNKISIHQLAAAEKGCEFVVEFDDTLPNMIVGDANRILQVINNLCSNAVKFTEIGRILLKITYCESKILRCEVIDTGVGIAKDDLQVLFREFQQIDNSFSREHQGTGLGLTISKQLVELMQGEIGVTSDIGIGSTFWFTIPVKEVTPNIQANKTPHLPNTLVLVKDELHASQWRELAHKKRFKLKACTDIASLISNIKTNVLWQLIVLIDYQDEIPFPPALASVQRVLSNNQQLLINTNIISEQADFETSDFKEFATTKFLNTHSMMLAELVSEQFDSLSEWYSNAQISKAISVQSTRILVVEDNSVNQLLFEEMLSETGAHITLANNGEEALEVLTHAKEAFSIVLMDCQMPVMDGFEATKQIRKHPQQQIANIRICAATAHGFDGDIQKCYEAGMNDVLIKPFSKQELLDTVMRNL